MSRNIVTYKDVDRYFKERPLKKTFLKSKSLYLRYRRNCHDCHAGINNVNYPNIDRVTGPFLWCRDNSINWRMIEQEFKKIESEL